jgi:hypothetical protein
MRRLPHICCLLLAAAAARADLPPLGRWDLPPGAGVAAVLRIDGDLALVGVDETEGGNPSGRLRLLDLGDPAAPVPRGDLALTGVPTDIAVHDGIAAVAWYHGRLNRGAVALVDVADPDHPDPLAEIAVYGKTTAVAWHPFFVLAAVEGTGAGIGSHLLVTYVSDPWQPIFIGTTPLPYAPTAMALDGDRLYLAGLDDSVPQLEWFDVSDPSAPQLLDSYGLSLLFLALEPQGEVLHTLLPDGTYVLVDISSGYHLWFRASLGLAPPAGALARRGDAVYAAAGDGLTIIGIADPDHPFAACAHAAAPSVDVDLGESFAALLDTAGLTTYPLCTEPMSNEPPPEPEPLSPVQLFLGEPYPNPFNPSVTVTYTLPSPGETRLTVHDARGRLVATLLEAAMPAGEHEATWTGRDETGRAMPTGTYYLRLETATRSLMQMATLLR